MTSLSFAAPTRLRWLLSAVGICMIWSFLYLYWGRRTISKIYTDVDVPYTIADANNLPDDICSVHGWKWFRPVSAHTPRKVFDLIMLNDELDWLEIRLNSTWDYVDYFVIVESDLTFTNLDKPLIIHDNMHLFKAYESKIIYHRLEEPDNFQPNVTWEREELQRNAMLDQVFPKLRGAQAPNPGDAIIVADVDEIVRPAALTLLRHCAFPRRLTLRTLFYYYSFQFRHRGPEWPHPQATYYEGADTINPTHLRGGMAGSGNEGKGGKKASMPFVWRLDQAELGNAGWHCSSCFATLGEMLNKMKSFSHVELNKAEFQDTERIVDRIRKGKDLWDRKGEYYDRVENNTDVPPTVRENPEKFRYMLDRDGPDAGFVDYAQYRHGN